MTDPEADGVRGAPESPSKHRSDALAEYRRKRAREATPEPFEDSGISRPGLFVVHLHAARRTHYDLRLEMDGVLRSWAVPKGPCPDPDVKRLAVETEDHPIEYGDFEGVIPADNYGAGSMIVWDRGRWLPRQDDQTGQDKLLFELQGYKLRGLWTLVRTKKDPREWLLIKKHDGWVRQGEDAQLAPESVLSGLTVEQLGTGHAQAQALRDQLADSGAPRRRVDARGLKVMLAKVVDRPFSKSGWMFELNYDGFRMIAARNDGRALLRYRRGRDATAIYPEIAQAIAALPYDALVVDGEVVVLDEESRPSFARLQRRSQQSSRIDIARAALENPATLCVFDLLAVEGYDLRQLAVAQRKALLRAIVPPAGPLRYADHVEARGEALYEEVSRRGLEGILAKRSDSRYRGGRSADWLKIRADRNGDFVIVGATAPKGSRSGFGTLHLGVYDGGRLLYVGRVGSGFDDDLLRRLSARMRQLQRHQPAVELPNNPPDDSVWVEPVMVCEVRYKERNGGWPAATAGLFAPPREQGSSRVPCELGAGGCPDRWATKRVGAGGLPTTVGDDLPTRQGVLAARGNH